MAARPDAAAVARRRAVLTEQVVDALAVIPPQAASAQALALADVEAAERAVAVVQRSAEGALDALRRLLLVLPEGVGSPYSPQPALADLYLEAARRRDDPSVRFVLPRDPGRVPAGVQLVVHHAVTAGLELADGAGVAATVRLRRRAGAVILAVELGDAVDARAADAALAGVRARAALYGGAVRCGGGRRVTVTLPVEEDAA